MNTIIHGLCLQYFYKFVSFIYFSGINFHGDNARVYTGITHGGYNLDVYMSEDGFLTDYSLIVNKHMMHTDLYDNNGHITFSIDHAHKHTTDRGVICKENKCTLRNLNILNDMLFTLYLLIVYNFTKTVLRRTNTVMDI